MFYVSFLKGLLYFILMPWIIKKGLHLFLKKNNLENIDSILEFSFNIS